MGNLIKAQVETYYDYKKGYIRVRPCEGQGLNTSWNVRFPRALRDEFKEGQKFSCNIEAKRNHYILKGEIELIQKITFSHGGKKTAEAIVGMETVASSSNKVKKQVEVPKLGMRKIKF